MTAAMTGDMAGELRDRRPVAVISVAYGAPALLDQALSAVSGAFPVTVVDNSSHLDVERVTRRHGAEYIDPGRNLGFGSAVNVALRDRLSGPPTDVLLLNPDATLSADGVRGLQSALHAPGAGRLGVVSAALIGTDLVAQQAIWPFPGPLRCWLEAIGLGRLNRSRDFVVGAVVMIKWEALQDVGLFDERFFLYAEETDWQRRAAGRGWRSDVCLAVTATHVGGATSTLSRRREHLFHAGTETYIRKWFGPLGWWSYRAAAVFGALVRAAVLPGSRGRSARERAGIYLRGPRRAAGLGKV